MSGHIQFAFAYKAQCGRLTYRNARPPARCPRRPTDRSVHWSGRMAGPHPLELERRASFKVSLFHAATILVLVGFDGFIARIVITALLAHHHADTVVGNDFVNDCGYDLVKAPSLGIVSGRDKIGTLVGYKFLGAGLFL